MRRILIPLALIAACMGCERNAVTTYRLEHDGRSAVHAVAAAPAMASPVTAAMGSDPSCCEIVWDAPAGWETMPASAMRKASYRLGEGADAAELSVVMLEGSGGTNLGNVNRWRGQLGLEPIAEEQLADYLEPLELTVGAGTLIDLEATAPPTDANTPGAMLIGVVPISGSTWFMKLTGSAAAVKTNRSALIACLSSLRLEHNAQ